MRRYKNPKNLKKALDREKLKGKPLVISARRKELNYTKGQQYSR